MRTLQYRICLVLAGEGEDQVTIRHAVQAPDTRIPLCFSRRSRLDERGPALDHAHLNSIFVLLRVFESAALTNGRTEMRAL